MQIFNRNGKEARKRLMFKKEKVLEASPVTSPQPLLDNDEQLQPQKEMTYVERRIKETMDLLTEKKAEMAILQKDIQQYVNETTLLQKIRDGKKGIYITDLLDMIDEYRGLDFQDQDAMLDKFEEDIIQMALQGLSR